GKQHRDAEAVDDARQHVAALVVGAEPVLQRRRRGRGYVQVVVDAGVVEGNRRPEHPAVLVFDQLAYVRALVVGFQRKLATEGGFRVTLEHRYVPFAVVTYRQRLVVGDQFVAQAEHEQREEQPQRPPATLVGLETLEAASVERGQFHLSPPGFRSRCADRPGCR